VSLHPAVTAPRAHEHTCCDANLLVRGVDPAGSIANTVQEGDAELYTGGRCGCIHPGSSSNPKRAAAQCARQILAWAAPAAHALRRCVPPCVHLPVCVLIAPR
jgi:hypothetical protein